MVKINILVIFTKFHENQLFTKILKFNEFLDFYDFLRFWAIAQHTLMQKRKATATFSPWERKRRVLITVH